MSINILAATATDLQILLSQGTITSRVLVDLYLQQISQYNGYLNAVIATAPTETLHYWADELDQERANGALRGPLHGIPILLKACLDNIATGPDLALPTTCGSLALVDSRARYSATILIRSRSDLANCGWSAVGGQTQSPYVRGAFRDDDSCGGHSNPGGLSSGSAAAVAAGFCPIAIGTETMGSLVMPSQRAALYTIKPTLKIVSQAGIIPISDEADMAGPMAKFVADLANLMDVLVEPSKTDIPPNGYISAVTGSWDGIKVGVVDPEKWLFGHDTLKFEQSAHDQMIREWSAAYEKLEEHAQVVKHVELISEDGNADCIIYHKFKHVLEKYLSTVDNCKIKTLDDLIEFNEQHAELELPAGANNQNGLLRARDSKMSDEEYHRIIASARETCGKNGIDKTLDDNAIDLIIGPGDGPMFCIAGAAGHDQINGYPIATLPVGYLDFNGRPFGFQVMARAHQDALLIRVQSAWEATFPERRPPPLSTDLWM
ncbi:amidase family protein [Dissoconium aciculare CBS 342.82]|uniref:Amidase family protein n=1 Tax=Dissoconium aciculare CBS 342.82 TaxID=1314786 RepID=A0A6J3LVW6_9PEZI|nr:amidase family protein [Dissoconium aciculare CBS 342.82]KAF1818772.1 amidase family protein [Dissoconium aciculare CBS 342.82]